jgi:hypothetical protein
MPLLAYIDDSGTHTNDSPICVAAGYFGGEHYWKQFDLEWGRAVKKRRLSEFHASRFWSRGAGGKTVGEYAGWSEQDCQCLLDELLDVIERYRIWPTGSAVVRSDWMALTPDERCYLTGGHYKKGRYQHGGAPNKPYFVPFLFAVQNMARHCDHGHTIDFIVDESRELNGYAQNYFQLVRKSSFPHAQRLGKIQAGVSKVSPGLQAADLLAYQTLRFTRDNPGISHEVDASTPLGRAIGKAKNIESDFKLLWKDSFDRLLATFREELATQAPKLST